MPRLYGYGCRVGSRAGAVFVGEAGRADAASARRPPDAPASTNSRGAPPMMHGAPFVQVAPGSSMV